MKDRFSNHASGYATFRPTYPKELYEFILSQVKEKRSAWDCGTGNGQVARDLAPHFQMIKATDTSEKQLEHATLSRNIQYSISRAEKTEFQSSSFDLITVGQAVHWFDIPGFYKEATRVAKTDAILAIWGYGLLKINPAIDEIIRDFYRNTIGPYWDPERKLIDQHYQTIPFPFEEIPAPPFDFSFQWTIDELQGYLTTWSAVQKYMKTNDADPVGPLIYKIRLLWHAEKCLIRFPLFLRCGRIVK